MDVSTDTLLKKMYKEMHRIEQSSTAEEARASFSHLKMLSELWLDEYRQQKPMRNNQTSVNPSISANIIDETQEAAEEQRILSAQQGLNEEEDDFSIFDF